MAKPLMISDEVYHKLKKIKEEKNESFSTVINNLFEDKPNKAIEALDKVAGSLKDDKEYDILMKENKKMWKRWGRKYA